MGRLSSTILSILIVLFGLFTVFGNHGLLQLLQMSEEIAQLSTENQQIESEIVQIQNQTYGVASSKLVLEQRAREELGLSKPGEIVYIFPHNYSRSIENSHVTDGQSEVPRKE